MTIEISTDTRNDLALALITWFSGKKIKIYGSPTSQAAADALIPATADAALGSATLLVTITNDGTATGLTLDATPTGGVVVKEPSETWKGTNVASGYASFYRAADTADDGSSSTTAGRLQGTVGTVGKDLIIQSAYLTSGQEQRIDSYSLAVPAE